MTILRVSDEIVHVFPNVVLGVVAFQNISNLGERAELSMNSPHSSRHTVAVGYVQV
jgi:hypothetical protein